MLLFFTSQYVVLCEFTVVTVLLFAEYFLKHHKAYNQTLTMDIILS